MLWEAFGDFWVKPKLESTKGGWDMTLDEIWDAEDLSTTGGRLINVYEVSYKAQLAGGGIIWN